MISSHVFLVCILFSLGRIGLSIHLPKEQRASTHTFLDVLLKVLHFQPETLMNAVELVTYYGFPVEVHTVTTEDGYILTLHRIPGTKIHKFDKNLLPMLIMHGILGSADNFLSNTPENCYPLILAKAGFDVWIANQRGSKYSRRHAFLNPDSAKYWDFSSDEIAEFDMSAHIDYILNRTGHKQIFYSGFSFGSPLIFALCSTRPEFMSKIKAIFSFASMGNLVGVPGALKLAAKFEPIVKFWADVFHFYELPAIPHWLIGLFSRFFDPIVRTVLFYVFGPDYQGWNSSRTEVHMAHYYTSSSFRIILHGAQIINTKEYKKFDWGRKTNLKKYGQATPPYYGFSNVTVPTHLYYARNDHFSTKENNQFLEQQLPNAVLREAGSGWNHGSFIWGKYAGGFYNSLVTFIKTF